MFKRPKLLYNDKTHNEGEGMTVRSSTVNQEYVSQVSGNNQHNSDEQFEINETSLNMELSFETVSNMTSQELSKHYNSETVPTLQEAQSLKSMTTYSDDKQFNMLLFNQAVTSLKQHGNLTTFSRNFTLPMLLISESGFIELQDITSPEAASKYGIKSSEALADVLEKQKVAAQNKQAQKVDDVITTMKKLPELYKEKQNVLQMDVAGMFQNFMQILSDFQALQNHNKNAMESYTKTNTHNPLI